AAAGGEHAAEEARRRAKPGQCDPAGCRLKKLARPALKRHAVAYILHCYAIARRRACSLVKQTRSTDYYRSVKDRREGSALPHARRLAARAQPDVSNLRRGATAVALEAPEAAQDDRATRGAFPSAPTRPSVGDGLRIGCPGNGSEVSTAYGRRRVQPRSAGDR